MKRFMQTAVWAALLAVPALGTAQDTKAVTLGVSGGLTLPMGDLSDNYSSGYSVAGHIFLLPANKGSLSFRGDISYDRFAAKKTVSGLDAFTSIGFLGNAVMHVGDAEGALKRPYVLVGGGLIRSKATRTGQSNVNANATDLGIQGGVGMEFILSGFSTFLEAKYVNGFLDSGSLSYIPITFGIKF